jgi:hypothetical protein
MPDHARVEAELVVTWFHRTKALMAQRDRFIHSLVAGRCTGDTTEPISVHLRSGDVADLSPEAISRLADELAAHFATGFDLVMRLRRESPLPGVYLANYVVDGDWSPIAAGGVATRWPTPEEFSAWFAEFGPFPSIGEGAARWLDTSRWGSPPA